MFSRIQTRHYRSLKAVDQSLEPIQALVGPNASGKTTFLDVIGLLGDLVSSRGEVREAIGERSTSFDKLLWQGPGADVQAKKAFQLAVEAPIPEHVRVGMAEDLRRFAVVRYEVEIGLDLASNELGLNHETLSLRMQAEHRVVGEQAVFPWVADVAPDILARKSGRDQKIIMKKIAGGNDNYYPHGVKSAYAPSFRLGPTKLGLSHIPADQANFIERQPLVWHHSPIHT